MRCFARWRENGDYFTNLQYNITALSVRFVRILERGSGLIAAIYNMITDLYVDARCSGSRRICPRIVVTWGY